MREAMCSVCAGTGKPLSDLPCICGGEGTESGECLGLRKALYAEQCRSERLQGIVEAARAFMELKDPCPSRDIVVIGREIIGDALAAIDTEETTRRRP